MVHLGPGAFFRAFIAPYTDEAMGAGSANGEDWGIIAVSLKSPTAREALVRKIVSIPRLSVARTATPRGKSRR